MRRSRKYLAALSAGVIALGLAQGCLIHAKQDPRLLGMVEMIFPMLLFAWCKADARERGISSGSAPVLVGLVAPIGLPIYFFSTLPPARAVWACAKALLCALTLALLSGATVVYTERILA